MLDGMAKVPDLVNKAQAMGMSALALTDHGNMFGIINNTYSNTPSPLNAGIKLSPTVPPSCMNPFSIPRSMAKSKTRSKSRKPY